MQNQEADDLTNMELRHFDPKKRIEVDINKLGFDLMESLFKVGDTYLAELENVRKAEQLKLDARRARGERGDGGKGKKMKGLRETDPWV